MELPVLSYQSSIRASQTRRGDFGAEMKKRMDDRRCGYLGCLDAVLDLKRVKEWCYEMQRIAFDQDRKVDEYEQFKYIVGSFMQKMSNTKEIPQIYYSRQHKDIVYCENQEVLPISFLSAGYQSLLYHALSSKSVALPLISHPSDVHNNEEKTIHISVKFFQAMIM